MTILPRLSRGGANQRLTDNDQRELVQTMLAQWPQPLRRVLLLPPDFTRLHSAAGRLTAIAYELLAGQAHVDIMPALGTHAPMTEREIRHMFGEQIPLARFLVHDWRNGLTNCGEVPAEMLYDWSEGRVNYPVRIEVNKQLFADYDLILSLGQVVPHEVVGLANYTKNIMVGVGGADTINKSHYLGAAYGMERIMGRIDTPVRRLFNYGVEQFLADKLPLCYLLTVLGPDPDSQQPVLRGLFAGTELDTFSAAARLSQQLNLQLLDEPIRRVVVWLDPEEFKSTWLGNKAVYRTRMAIADAGELIILAPGLREFGEDRQIDSLIHRYGYHGTAATLAAVAESVELQQNLGAAAHLIHGSSDQRFRITYCPGHGLDPASLQAVGYATADLASMLQRYHPEKLQDGFNRDRDGESVFFVRNPGQGLWALRRHFAGSAGIGDGK